MRDKTIHSTPCAECPACQQKRLHTAKDWKHHPYAGNGFVREQGWSHQDLEPKKAKGANV